MAYGVAARYVPGTRDTSMDRPIAKRIRRLPICLPTVFDYRCEGEVLSWIARWKRFWLAHWLSPSFRGRLSAKDYARMHGVTKQAVVWLAKRGKLGNVVRDSSAHYWIDAGFPYPERHGSRLTNRRPDPSVRPLDHTDFRLAEKRGGKIVQYTPTVRQLEEYGRFMLGYHRTTLEEEMRRYVVHEGMEIRATGFIQPQEIEEI